MSNVFIPQVVVECPPSASGPQNNLQQHVLQQVLVHSQPGHIFSQEIN
jgi:hypothetical protein